MSLKWVPLHPSVYIPRVGWRSGRDTTARIPIHYWHFSINSGRKSPANLYCLHRMNTAKSWSLNRLCLLARNPLHKGTIVSQNSDFFAVLHMRAVQRLELAPEPNQIVTSLGDVPASYLRLSLPHNVQASVSLFCTVHGADTQNSASRPQFSYPSTPIIVHPTMTPLET